MPMTEREGSMTEANAGQAEFWNSGPGQNWVAFQADLDEQLASITDRLIAACALRPGENALDVGCGAGGTTLALAAAVGPSGHVDGLDISRPLLELAERRARDAGAGNARFLLGDAQDQPLPRGGYDLVTSRFGVMFFADPVAAFRNLCGGLKPGGRIVFLVWAGPESNPWFSLPLQVAVARLGPQPPTPPDAPGPMAFRDVGRVLGILEAAGFVAGAAERIDGDLYNSGGLDAVMRLLGRIGPLPRLFRENGTSEADREAILAEVRAVLAPFRSPDGIRVPAGFLLYSARRPA
jgi:SAM-dependent methyltransferase